MAVLNFYRLALAGAFVGSIATSAVAAPQSVAGRWLDQDKGGVIQIGQCGATVCGTLVQILEKGKANALDQNNPNPALRNRPLKGINLLYGFVPDGQSWKGSIYDPRRGKVFKSFVKLNPNGTLSVKGCWGFLCQTQTWTRVK